MKIGFTGTRNGCTPDQFETLVNLLHAARIDSHFHHGDCIGADAEAARAAWEDGYYVVCHPPLDDSCQAHTTHNHEWRTNKTHFARNREIVNATEMLIACPQYMEPITKETKGGTAYTVNYARKQGKPVTIIRPDGSTEELTA